MSPTYFCFRCYNTVIGFKTSDNLCIFCNRKKICSEISYNYYFSSIFCLDLPLDIVRIICFYCEDSFNEKNTLEVHNCCWRTIQHSSVYVPKFGKKSLRLR